MALARLSNLTVDHLMPVGKMTGIDGLLFKIDREGVCFD